MTTNQIKMTNGALAALIKELLTNPQSGEIDSMEGFESLIDDLTEVICKHCGGHVTDKAAHQVGETAMPFESTYAIEVDPGESSIWAQALTEAPDTQARPKKGLPNGDDFAPIIVGQECEFHAEMQQAELPAHERMRNYTGQIVTVISGPEPKDDQESSDFFVVRAADGREFTAAEEELNGWDKTLGQFFWPDGTYGHSREQTFLVNEKIAATKA